MIIMYKLVTQELTSYGGMKWEIGKTKRAMGGGNSLCSEDLLHCYSDPRLAVLFNPIHANYVNPRLLEIECSGIVAQDGLKFGCKEQTPIRELPLPKITLEQKVHFAIRCALGVYKERGFVKWAENWISGTDRTAEAARAARDAWDAWDAFEAAAEAANKAAFEAAWDAVEAAAWAAAETAAWAAWAAAWAAWDAWDAARAASKKPLDFLSILEEVGIQLKGEGDGNG